MGAFVLDLVELAGEDLPSIFGQLIEHCRLHKLEHGLDHLSWNDFGMQDSFTYPHFCRKGFSCKVFAHFLAERLQKSPGLERQAQCAWHLMELQRVVDSAGPFLSEAEASSLVCSGQLFLDFWQELVADNFARNRANYKVRPKHHTFAHYVVHDVRRGSRMNPKLVSCWMDEDFVGRMCRMIRGLHPTTLARRSLERFLLETNRRRSQPVG